MRRKRKLNHGGYTLTELCVTLVIVSVTAAIIYPVIVPVRGERSRQWVCVDHLKKIGSAAMLYAQDYDGTLPPATAPEEPSSPHAPPRQRFWLGSREKSARNYRGFQTKNGFLTNYLNGEAVCWCPTPDYESPQAQRFWKTGRGDLKTVYMTSDLTGGAKKDDFANPAATVIATEGGTALLIAGHVPFSHTATRHNGGANYLFGDGHARWNKPEFVFFPRNRPLQRSHSEPKTNKPVGPDPGGDMTFNGHEYTATFHLR